MHLLSFDSGNACHSKWPYSSFMQVVKHRHTSACHKVLILCKILLEINEKINDTKNITILSSLNSGDQSKFDPPMSTTK